MRRNNDISSLSLVIIQCLSQNIFLGSLITASLIGIHQAYQIITLHLFAQVNTQQILLSLIIGLSLSFFRKKRTILLVVWAMHLALFIQLIHYAYFGTRIAPIDISLFFSHTMETMQTFTTILSITILPAIICLTAFLIVALGVKQCSTRLQWRYSWIILILALASPLPKIINTIIHHGVHRYSNESFGDRPSINDDLWISTQKTVLYYLSTIFTKPWIAKNSLPQILAAPLSINTPTPNLDIILVMGESLTYNHLSSYGYARPTTPYLNSLKHNRHVIFKQGISSGVSTEVSLAMFFNMVPRPDGTMQIASTNRNLFKMAKNNGFETYFISAQAPYFLGVIKNYLFPAYIDHYGDSSLFVHGFRNSALDEKLAEYLQSLDFSHPSFIVLHQQGSHTPYIEHYPTTTEFNVFKSNHHSFQQKQIDTYDNSIRYTDSLLAKIQTIIQKKSHRPTLLIFTADHGESLGEQGIYGHNNLQIMVQHQVPIIIFALNGASLDFFKQKNRYDKNPRYMSHYELSELIAYSMGYQLEHFSEQETGYFVLSNVLSGTAGFSKFSFDQYGTLH